MKYFTALALAFVLFVAGQAAWAASTFEVTNVANVFTITRSEKTAEETVYYRTVSFSALAGKHFTEVSGTLSFAVGEGSKTVTVTETADIGALAVPYRYQAFESRTYRFEVLNTGGNCVAFCDRDIPYGSSYQVLPENLFSNVAVSAFNDPVTVDDVGFGTAPNTYHAINIGNYFSAAAPQEYVCAIGAQLAMSFDFQACEIDDGYQYLQVLVDDDTNYDGGNQDGKVGDIVYAQFMAGFGHYPAVKNTSYAYYTFPYAVGGGDITQGCIVGLWEKYGNPESLLYSQRIKPGYHHGHSGRVLADADLQKLGVRFDASGKHDDKWKVKDFKAHLQAIDDCAPTMLESDVKVSAGPYNTGNTFYVSVPFSEIVYANTVFYVDETPTITTTWGDLTYYTGKGTNVLTFKGEIGYNLDTGTSLTITGLSGRVRDMRGNLYKGTEHINVTIPGYNITGQWGSDLGADGTEAHPYVISSKDDFEALVARVNGGDDFGPDASHPDGYFFQQAINIDYAYTSGGNNYVAIGTKDNPFRGNYDGKGFVISGIQILKVNGSDADSYQGVFGHVVGGTVKNVIVKNADIWGNNYIAGVVGCCEGGVISGCIVHGLKVTSGGNNRGVIVGNNSATLTDNYYRDCAVGISNSASTTSIGYFNGHSLVDEEGAAEPVYTLILDNGLSASGATFTLSDVSYYAKNTEVTLSYNGNVDAGFNALKYELKNLSLSSDYSDYGLVDGFTFRMPGEDLNASVNTNDLALALFDDDNARPEGKKNVDYIAVGGGPKKVEIHGRRLYQDGEWNTLCLPFDVDNIASSSLAGATLRELDVDNTSFNAGTGTLSLRFKEATSIIAGKPYLIKWGAKEGAAGYVGTAIDSPRFNGVTINAGAPAVVTSADGYVSFTGNYSPLTSDNTMLLLDGSASIGAFRAYIQLNKGITVNDILVYNTSGDVEDPVTLTGHYCDGFYWASYFNGEESPCMLTAGAQAFTMDAEYVLHRLGTDGRIIPTNTAVVILSEREQITLTPTRETATPHGTNILRGSEVPVAVANAYVLGIVDGTIGFYSFTGAEVPAKKAYYVKP